MKLESSILRILVSVYRRLSIREKFDWPRKLFAMHVNELPERSQDYLKKIYDLQEWADGGVNLTALASHMDQRPSTASEAVKRLATQGLVEHTPYKDIQLSPKGRELALIMVRRHRLIETFLSEKLGYSMDELHDEAETLEHAVSDFFIERISALMDHPTRDPHGDPIPDAAGQFHVPAVTSLAHTDAGSIVYIDRISDKDDALLRYLNKHGLLPGVKLEIQERVFEDMAELLVLPEGRSVQLPASSLNSILVREQEADSLDG